MRRPVGPTSLLPAPEGRRRQRRRNLLGLICNRSQICDAVSHGAVTSTTQWPFSFPRINCRMRSSLMLLLVALRITCRISSMKPTRNLFNNAIRWTQAPSAPSVHSVALWFAGDAWSRLALLLNATGRIGQSIPVPSGQKHSKYIFIYFCLPA